MSIKAIIFDIGGVLSRLEDPSIHRKWEARVGLAPGELATRLYENDLGRQAMLGLAMPAEVWATVGRDLGLSDAEIAEARAEFWEGAAWDRELLDFLRAMKPRYRLGILSDAWSNVRTALAAVINDELFDVIMYSAEEGLQKPDAELFQRMLDRLGVAPQEAIFVDDRAHNVAGAQALGIHAFLYTTTTEVLQQINALLAEN